MSVAATVILFNPEKKTINNVLSYSFYVNTVYAWDNSEISSPEIAESLKEIVNCKYIQDGQNKGIARRLNQVCKLAIADGHEWLLTMDQDSSFSSNNISTYITCLQGLTNKEEIAVAGAAFEKRETGGIDCIQTEVTSLITSGSMINLSLFNKIGLFDEALFIDYVDHEYCYRAVLNGYKVIKFANIFLQHALGIISTHTSLKTLKKSYRTLHSPLRIYYMTRNYLYLRAKYKKTFPAEILIAKKDLLIRMKNNLLYNNKRISVFKFFILGIIDYKKNKMGKIEN